MTAPLAAPTPTSTNAYQLHPRLFHQLPQSHRLPIVQETTNQARLLGRERTSTSATSISGHVQTYELGCEASAAVDWAGYYDVLIYESTFQFGLPLSDNPELGFVGNVTTDGWGQIPPDAYGVHAEPIAELLREYGLPAQAV